MSNGYWWQPWLGMLFFGAGGLFFLTICINGMRRGKLFIGGGRSAIERVTSPIRFWFYTAGGLMLSLWLFGMAGVMIDAIVTDHLWP